MSWKLRSARILIRRIVALNAFGVKDTMIVTKRRLLREFLMPKF